MTKALVFSRPIAQFVVVLSALVLLVFAPYARAEEGATARAMLPRVQGETVLAAASDEAKVAALTVILNELISIYNQLVALEGEAADGGSGTDERTLAMVDGALIILLDPNGGEEYTAGESAIAIKYQGVGNAGKGLTAHLLASGITSAATMTGTVQSAGEMTLAIGENITSGVYKIKLCVDGVTNAAGAELCDTSNNFFTILPKGRDSENDDNDDDDEDEEDEDDDEVNNPPGMLARDYIGNPPYFPCPWGEPTGPCKYQGKLMSEAYPPPSESGFREVNSGEVPFWQGTNHQPLFLGGGKKWSVKFKADANIPSVWIVFGGGTVPNLQVPMEMFVSVSRTKGDFDVKPSCLVTPASLSNPGAGGAPHSYANIRVAWTGGPYDQGAASDWYQCTLDPTGYYYLNVAGTCSEYWDPDHAYLGWQHDCPTVLVNTGWMNALSP